jgi:fumarate reductase subunit D
MAALAGAICAQTVIWLSMWLFTDGVNYEHIRRLDWLIVLACALLTAIGAVSRPDLPVVRTAKYIRTVTISLAVVAVTAVALLVIGSMWSPAQRMPSAIGVEQVSAPTGADVAFALAAIGPEGPALIQRAVFTASDDTGRPVAVSTRLLLGGTADPVTLLVVLDPGSQQQLCEGTAATVGNAVAVVDGSEHSRPVKLTVRDQGSGALVQAVIPAEWCVP